MNDYEEDNAEYGVESVGWIAAHLKAKDMGCDHHTCDVICDMGWDLASNSLKILAQYSDNLVRIAECQKKLSGTLDFL